MAVTTMKKVSVSMKLNNGTDSEGNVKLVSVSFPNLSEEYYTENTSTAEDKYLEIATVLAPCLAKTTSSIEIGTTSTLSAA